MKITRCDICGEEFNDHEMLVQEGEHTEVIYSDINAPQSKITLNLEIHITPYPIDVCAVCRFSYIREALDNLENAYEEEQKKIENENNTN